MACDVCILAIEPEIWMFDTCLWLVKTATLEAQQKESKYVGAIQGFFWLAVLELPTKIQVCCNAHDQKLNMPETDQRMNVCGGVSHNLLTEEIH